MNSKFVQDYFNQVRQLRLELAKMGEQVHDLMDHPGLYGINAPGEDRAEAKANVMLAFRASQDAALRLSQSLHAMGGGCDASTQEKCCGAPEHQMEWNLILPIGTIPISTKALVFRNQRTKVDEVKPAGIYDAGMMLENGFTHWRRATAEEADRVAPCPASEETGVPSTVLPPSEQPGIPSTCIDPCRCGTEY